MAHNDLRHRDTGNINDDRNTQREITDWEFHRDTNHDRDTGNINDDRDTGTQL